MTTRLVTAPLAVALAAADCAGTAPLAVALAAADCAGSAGASNRPVLTADTQVLDKDAHTEDVPHHDAARFAARFVTRFAARFVGRFVTRFAGRFAPRSRVRAGHDIRVVAGTGCIHFPDPGTGLAIRE
jgi:hypothetical protein